jgi:DNA-binding transcriptional LysR family regulator
MFDWENLRHYLAFVSAHSLNGAARELGVEHATVARRIAALEQALNFKLVDRRQRKYQLTSNGHRIAEIGQRMHQDALAIRRIARSAQAQPCVPLSISAPAPLASAFIAPHLGHLRRQHPAIDISLLLPDDTEQDQPGKAPEPDLLISLRRPAQADMVVRRLASLSYGLYAATDYTQAHPPKQYDYILYDQAMNASPQQQWLHEVAGERPVVLRARSPEVRAAAARSGLGITLLPDYLGRQDSQLQRLANPTPALLVDVWLGVHGELRNDPSVRAVMDFLIGCFPADRSL